MSVDVGKSRRRRRMRRRRRRLHRRHLGGVALLEDGVRVREDPGLRRALGGAEQPAHLEALVQRHLPVVREVALRQAPPQRGHVVRLRPPAGAQLEAEALGAGPHRAVRVHEDRERRGSIGAFGGWERARTGRHGARCAQAPSWRVFGGLFGRAGKEVALAHLLTVPCVSTNPSLTCVPIQTRRSPPPAPPPAPLPPRPRQASPPRRVAAGGRRGEG